MDAAERALVFRHVGKLGQQSGVLVQGLAQRLLRFRRRSLGEPFADRNLGIEHWIDQVVPRTIAAVSADAGGRPVHLAGWCLGGIFSLFTLAARPRLPVQTIWPVTVTPVALTASTPHSWKSPTVSRA